MVQICSSRQRLPLAHSQQSTISRHSFSNLLLARKNNEGEKDKNTQTGMNDAFRQLDALDALFDDNGDTTNKEKTNKSSKKFN
jgi:hypothetical protein